MSNTPKVTVCIPVFNGEAFIGDTLEALLQQDYESYEVIVIDNASEDKTREIVKNFEDRGVRLLVNEKNLGMTGNFNECLKHAEGDYVQILCSDDRLANDCLKKKVAALEANPSCVMCVSATEIRDDDGKVRMVRRSFSRDMMIKGSDMIKKSFRKRNLYGEPSNVLIRTSAISDGTGFDPQMYYAVDWEFWLRLSLKGDVYYINEPLAAFYMRSGSETGSLLKKKERIVKDDKLLVKLCLENKDMALSGFDGFRHTLSSKIRLYMKIVYSKLIK